MKLTLFSFIPMAMSRSSGLAQPQTPIFTGNNYEFGQLKREHCCVYMMYGILLRLGIKNPLRIQQARDESIFSKLVFRAEAVNVNIEVYEENTAGSSSLYTIQYIYTGTNKSR